MNPPNQHDTEIPILTDILHEDAVGPDVATDAARKVGQEQNKIIVLTPVTATRDPSPQRGRRKARL